MGDELGALTVRARPEGDKQRSVAYGARGTQVSAELESHEEVPRLQAQALSVPTAIQAQVLPGVQAVQQDAVAAISQTASLVLRVPEGPEGVQVRQLAPSRAAGLGSSLEALPQVQPEGKGTVEVCRQKLAAGASQEPAAAIPRRSWQPGAAAEVSQRQKGDPAPDAAALSAKAWKPDRPGR